VSLSGKGARLDNSWGDKMVAAMTVRGHQVAAFPALAYVIGYEVAV
jgi:hypothetical protein